MRRLGGGVVAAVALAAALAVPAAARPPAPAFTVGAASADITPPPAGAPNPASCGSTAAYAGRHRFSLEEPYRDGNGNGRYDPGESFRDCPVPTATGGVRQPDGRWDGIYLGGGDCCNRLPTRVLDPLEARTIVVASGRRRISITSVDNEGIFKDIYDEVRAKVRAEGGFGLDEMFFSSTHDESAPDTIGISGPTQTVSGVDPFYVEFMIERIARSIRQAARSARPATIRYGQAHPDDLIPCFSSYPFTADEQIGAMQARDRRGRVIATLANYGIHAEELGFSEDNQDRLHISADWPHFARAALERRYGGMAVTLAGAVGSVEMPQVYPSRRSFAPVPVHRSRGNGGCRTVYATQERQAAPYGYLLSTRARGEAIARWTARALAKGAYSRSSAIDFARRRLLLRLDNALFLAAGPIGIFPYKSVFAGGVRAPQLPSGAEVGNQIQTELVTYRIGDGQFVSTPGEVFPYTYAHDFGGPDNTAVPGGAPPVGWIMARMSGRWRFVEGLGEDMIGYLFPRSNAVGVPTATNPEPDDQDRFGCGHSDDAEAASLDGGDQLNAALLSMLPPTRDQVLVGRYVWRDGSLHRSPVADGGLGCQGSTAPVRPAPGGGAIGVWLLPPGVTRFAPGVGTVLPGTRWMDLRGRPRPGPSTQTRGVLVDGRRRWVDVFPDAGAGRVCVDRRAPRTRIGRASLSGGRLLLRGTARDRGCRATSGAAAWPGAVARVGVWVARRAARGRCLFLGRRGRLSKPRSCHRPLTLRARGARRWALRLRARLTAGRWTVTTRAVDLSGSRERPGARRRLRVR